MIIIGSSLSGLSGALAQKSLQVSGGVLFPSGFFALVPDYYQRSFEGDNVRFLPGLEYLHSHPNFLKSY